MELQEAQQAGAVKSKPQRANFDSKSRRCTDCLCCIIFLILVCGSFAIFFYSLTISNWKFIYLPHDSRQLLCGYDNSKLPVENNTNLPDLTNKTELFWVRVGKLGYALSFCVEKCPSEGKFTDSFTFYLNQSGTELGLSLEGSPKNATCVGDSRATVEGYTIGSNISLTTDKDHYCAYNSTSFFHRCIPNFFGIDDNETSKFTLNLSTITDTSTIVTAVQDFFTTWPVILVAAIASLALSIIWLFCLRCCAGVFVWCAVILAVAGLAALTAACYFQMKNQFDNVSKVTGYTLGIYSSELNQKVFKVLFYVSLVATIIFVLLLIFLFPRIKLSIIIIKIVSKAFGDVPGLFFFPIFIFLMLIIWWAYTVVGSLFLYGAGKPTYVADFQNSGFDIVDYKYDIVIQYLAIYYFVIALWVSFFLSALNEMTIGGVMGLWYVAENPKRKTIPHFTSFRTFGKAVRYHTGSLAMGSFIITVCRVIRAILMYIDYKTKHTQSAIAKFVIKCLRCCMWCLEKFLKFLNRNAYTLIINHGYSFWPACKQAFELIVSNCVRVATSNSIGDFTLFLGRVFVSTLCTAASLFYLYKQGKEVTFIVVPGVIIFVVCYILTIPFTSLFEVGVDCMFLCFFEDERNGASNTPEELRNYVNKNFKDEKENNKQS